MLPGAFFPIRLGECAGSRSFLRTLGIEDYDAQERFSTRFCSQGCCPFCQQEAAVIRARWIGKDRIPLFVNWYGNITGFSKYMDRKIPDNLLRRSVYKMEVEE